MSSSPTDKKARPRPKIKLPVPGQYVSSSIGTPYGQTSIPVTPAGSAQPNVLYVNKASEFVFAQFRGIKDFTKSGLSIGEKSAFWLYEKVSSWSKRWFTHIFLFMVVLLYSIGGAWIFVYLEGMHEERVILDLRKDRNETVNVIKEYCKSSHPDLLGAKIANQLMNYELQLKEHHKHGYMNEKDKIWTFWNAMFYCGTIFTTIGYGHISPSTTTGRAITIVYAIFGIPMFLIILADFGKLFTRGIKFLWAFVRRLYYTGSCRKVRKTARVQEVMKGVQLVYDIATFRRPSQMTPEDIEEMKKQQTILNLDANTPVPPPETPATPALSAFAIDDEFNLPISVAITILLIYIFVGATFFNLWENWGFFESFYFVFISMSTIGFGDYVPKHPIYMMCSIVYLVFGLALTSMCINVVQVMLSDSFKHATQKIGATIGFEVAEEDGSIDQAGDGGSVPPPVEVAEIHTTIPEENDDQHLKIPKDIK